MALEHRQDCELLTVTTYGLCTCDFDKQVAANILRDKAVFDSATTPAAELYRFAVKQLTG